MLSALFLEAPDQVIDGPIAHRLAVAVVVGCRLCLLAQLGELGLGAALLLVGCAGAPKVEPEPLKVMNPADAAPAPAPTASPAPADDLTVSATSWGAPARASPSMPYNDAGRSGPSPRRRAWMCRAAVARIPGSSSRTAEKLPPTSP